MADKGVYIAELKQQLSELDREIARRRREVDSGALRHRPEAAGELAVLQDRHKEVEQRLAEAEKRDAEDWSDLHAGFREQLDGIGDALERLFGPRRG